VPVAFADNLIQSRVSVDGARRAIIQEAARGVPRIDNRAPAVATRDGNDGLIGRMELFTGSFQDLLLFVYHCFDRVVIHGYLSGLSRPEQVV
jgi:hypothetical protein